MDREPPIARRGVRAAYVVLTHTDWPQVERLLGAIRASSPGAFILVAHDNRATRFPHHFEDPGVELFEHGLATDWGSWELVEATLRAFEHARNRADPDLVVLVSGQDYPIRRLSDWEAEVLASDRWVGAAEALQYTPHWGRRRGQGRDELTRYTHWWFQTPAARRGVRFDGRIGRWLQRVREAIALRTEPLLSVRFVTRGRGVFWGIRRPTPFSQKRPCYYGSQWIALPRTELDHLLDQDLAPGSRLRGFYRRTVIPDESALVTPLSWRSVPADLSPVTHVRWDHALDQPAICVIEDLEQLVRSGSPFCRKIDPVISASLIDELDRRLSRTEPSQPAESLSRVRRAPQVERSPGSPREPH
ncbi:beta-1,6-N-acetylglucosaminyltransferase [Agromyces sp. NPDC049794]|uniref:beta-1,6-N-acetylglucosaminyltransferase n=1 Tax=unclassified Agromyces TaxID=2639701 RepID=UPI0033F6E884